MSKRLGGIIGWKYKTSVVACSLLQTTMVEYSFSLQLLNSIHIPSIVLNLFIPQTNHGAYQGTCIFLYSNFFI